MEDRTGVKETKIEKIESNHVRPRPVHVRFSSRPACNQQIATVGLRMKQFTIGTQLQMTSNKHFSNIDFIPE